MRRIHPPWCDQEHPDDIAQHTGTVGDLLDAAGEVLAAVFVVQSADNLPVLVELDDYRGEDATVVTDLTLDMARQLRDLLDTALTRAGAR
jgi:predicted RNA-binding protein Jag